MSWEPDTEENRLGKVRKELEDLKANTSFLNTSINDGMSSNAIGANFGVSSFNQGANGDVPQQIENFLEDVSGTFWGIVDVIGSMLVISPSSANEQVANQSTIRKLNGGVDGQKTVIKPAQGTTIKLINNPNTNLSTDGNLLIGADLVLTDTESVTLRFVTDILYKDSYENNDPTKPVIQKIGGWIIESTGSGSGNSTSGVLKDPVKVSTTANVTNLNFSSPIDGIAMTVGDRFLVKDQTAQEDNGIYIWANGSASTRASDMSDGSVQKEGTMTYVQDGLTQNERLYAINIGGNNILIGTDNNTWGEIGSGSGGGSGAIKSPVKYATTANITLSGEQSIDGTATSTSRVLVKNQTTSSQNGIYVTATGAWARSTDMSTGSTIEGGTMVYVTDGTVNGDNLFGLTTEGTVTVGTGNQAWANLTAGGANTALSNLALTTSINSDLTMQNGFSIANLERVAFNTRTSSGIAGSISYNGTDILAKGSGAEINLTSPTNNWSDITIDTSKDMLKYSLTNLGAVSFKDSGNVVRGSLTADSTNSSLTLNIATNPLRITNVNTEIATFSTTTSDEVNFFGDLDMNQNVIFELDSIVFDAFSTGSGDGKSINTGTGTKLSFDLERTSDFFEYKIGGSQKLAIGNTNIQSLLPLQMNTNSITDVTVFNMATYAGSAPTGNGNIWSDGTDIKVRSGGAERNLSTIGGFPNPVTGTLDMNDNMITNITLAGIVDTGSTSRGSISGDSTNGLVINGALTTIVDTTNTIASFSNTTGDEVNFFGDLDMNQNVIFEVDSIVFDAFSTGNADGKSISTPSGTELLFDLERTSDFFNFKVGGNQKLAIANTNIQSLLPLQMNSNSITDVTVFNMSAYSGSAPTGNGNMWLDGTDVKVRTGGVEKSLSNIGSGGSSGANDTLSNLSSPVAINQTLLPNVASGVIYSLGSSSAKWRHMFTEKLGFGTTAMTMPTTTGTNGQVLTTNGSTTLSWSTASGGATIELDNLGTTSLNAGLNMNTNEITFDADADTSIYSSIDDELLFHTGGSVRLKMENSRFLFSNDITMAGNSGAGTENDINIGNNSITFTDTTQQITSLANGIKYLVPTNDTHSFAVNNDVKLTISGTTVTITDPISMNTVNKITNLATPTSDYDASTKKYVDDNAGSFYGIQDYEIPTEHESNEWDFENYITNSKNGMVVGQNGYGLATDCNWYVPVYIAKDVTCRELGFNNIAKATGLMSYTLALFSNRSGGTSDNVSGDGQNYPYKRLVQASASNQSASNEAKIVSVYKTISAGLYWICLNITYTQISNSLPYVYHHDFVSANNAGYFRDDSSFASDWISPICVLYDSASSVPTYAQNDMSPNLANGAPALFMKCT